MYGQYENAISNQVLVRMQKGQDPYFMLRNTPAHFEINVESILSPHADIWLLDFNDAQTDIAEVLSLLQKQSSILYVQPNRKVELRAAPNDPFYGSQWHHSNIDSELAWDITTGGTTPNGKEIVVALIESADLLNHDDLSDNHWVNTEEIPNNGVDDDGNGYIDDYNGWNVSTNNDNIGAGSHGTSCAGMMGAKGNNDQGVSGINWDLKIMDIAGYSSPFTEANIVASYNYALSARLLWNQTNGARGAFVVATSSSWGVDGGNPANYPIWCSFYDDLGQAGILSIGATTNQNQDVDTFGDVPTTCSSDYMISVTATNNNDIIDFAGYGDQTIDVAAPGSSIFTTSQNNSYGSTSGTSFACPLTAGLVGLMYSIPCSSLETMAINDPSGTAEIVRQAMFAGVDQTPHLQARTVTGGRINAKNSLDELMNIVCGSCMPPTNISTINVNDYDAKISFIDTAVVNDYLINIQVAGSGNWSNYTFPDTSYLITGLTSCTSYEYTISTICDGEIGSPSQIYSFTTSGCGSCIELPYCANEANVNSTPTLTVYHPNSISGSYTFEATTNWGGDIESGYVFGELVLVDDGTTSPNEGCNALINGTALNGNIAIVERGNCNFTVKAMNAQNAGATAVIVINNGPGTIDMGGNSNTVTIPAVMISQADGNTLISSINNGDQPNALLGVQNEWIEEFEIDGNIFSSGDNNGYIFNDNSFNLNIGQNYPFSLTPGFDGQALEEYTRIWIDINQNGVFDNSELLFDQGMTSTGAVNDNFTIPPSATLGKTRMRVQMAYQGAGATGLPAECGNFDFGEVEDYCIEIRSGIACGIVVNPTVLDPTCNEVQDGAIALNTSGGTPGYTFMWNNGLNSENISNLNTNNYSVLITDATGCDTTVNFSLIYDTQLSINENITPPTCENATDASITVNASGGTGFTYQWNNGPNSDTWNNIGSGNYQVTATDNIGCEITSQYNVLTPNVPLPTAGFTADQFDLVIEFTNGSQGGVSYLWDFGDGNTSTAFEPTHTYATTDLYDVCLTVYGDCDTVVTCNSFNIQNVGLDNQILSHGIKLFPNPASSSITIEKENDDINKVIVYSSTGKIVEEINLLVNNQEVTIENWSAGIYYFHFITNKEEYVFSKRLSVVK